MDRLKVVIMGAAGRDFHDFNVVYRDDPAVEVVAFTATQIPGIDGPALPAGARRPALPGGDPDRPRGRARADLREPEDRPRRLRLQRRRPRVRHAPGQPGRSPAARTSCSSGPSARWSPARKPVVATGATRTGAGKSQTTRYLAAAPRGAGPPRRRRPPPDALRRPRQAARPALRDLRRPRPPRDDDRGARGVRAAPRRRARPLRRRRLRGDPPRGGEGGRRRHLGRRQQRLPVLQARPLRRRRRPAPPRPRDALPPRRDEHPDGRRGRHQQGRQRHARAGRDGPRRHRPAQPAAPR